MKLETRFYKVMMIMSDPSKGIWIVPGISHETPARIQRNFRES